MSRVQVLRRVGVAVAAGAVALGVAGPAKAAVPDQVGPGPYQNVVDAFNASDVEAQTIVAGKTGLLVRVDVPILLVDPAAGDLVAEITGQTPDQKPDLANVLATQVVPQSAVPGDGSTLSVNFSAPAKITAGTGYAIVLTSTAGSLDCGNGQCPGQSYAVLTSYPMDTYPSGFVCSKTAVIDSCETSMDWLFTTYVQEYVPTGFFQPVDNGLLNIAQAGRSIPLKWRTTDADGNPVSDPASFGGVTSTQVSGSGCGSLASGDPVEAYSNGGGLQYLGDGNWQFNWATLKSWSGQCRTVTLTLGDGTTLQASFRFR